MKKSLCLALALAMVLLLCGCQSKEAKNADTLIASIGEVALESEAAISEAENAVLLLTEKDKESLNNLSVLESARAQYDLLVRQEKASAVDELIRAIGEVDADSDDQVAKAREAYDALDADEKTYVTEADALLLAEESLKKAHVSRVQDLIDSLGEITLDSLEPINDIANAVSELSEEEKLILNESGKFQVFVDATNQYWELLGSSLIHIDKIAVSSPDSAGGVMVYFNFTNRSEKTIKYITFGYSFYNSVGDLVRGRYDREDICYGKVTGPYEKGKGLQGTTYYWGKHYGTDLTSIKLAYLAIEYTDGSTMVFTDKMLEAAQK